VKKCGEGTNELSRYKTYEINHGRAVLRAVGKKSREEKRDLPILVERGVKNLLSSPVDEKNERGDAERGTSPAR